MAWFLLSIAIVAEIVGTLFLKASDGLSKLWPSIGVAVGYTTAGIPLLIEKYKVNLARIFDKPRQEKILSLSLDYEGLIATPVNEFMDLMAL